jgi:hypothetical protein
MINLSVEGGNEAAVRRSVSAQREIGELAFDAFNQCDLARAGTGGQSFERFAVLIALNN